MMESQSRKDLEFDVVLERFSRSCLSPEGRRSLLSLPLVDDREILTARQETIEGFITLLSSGMAPPPTPFPDMEESLSRLSDPRVSLIGATIHAWAMYIESAERLRSFCATALEDGKPIACLSSLLGDSIDGELVNLKKEILSTLESDGTVKESHPAIAALLRKVEEARENRQKFVHDFVSRHRDRVQSDQGALRDGRMVIAMRSDRTEKSELFVTGTSQSGSTLFVEPFRLVEMNNSVILAREQILLETARILKRLGDKVREQRENLASLSAKIAHADSLYALAVSAREFSMTRTDLEKGRCSLLSARHPLLGRKAVPLTIDLREETRAVVLTGPNAGGKTVTIKTVGLLAMLNQLCGYIPAGEGSSLPLFDNVFTEIGDEQSIEEGLSTFSSHMRRIAFILDHMSPRSLLILDELGSGTDPVEGSALARAILEECLKRSALTLVTSHHGVLKEFAYARRDVMNASMAFDESTHLPTFRLIQGLPGESHALDTALAMRLPPSVLERAKFFLGSSALRIGDLIKGLEEKRRELEEREREMERDRESLSLRMEKVRREELDLRAWKMRLTDEQDTELSRFMREKNRELETLVADLRSGEVTKEKTVKVKSFVSSLKERKEETDAWLEREEEILTKKMDGEVFTVGDSVLCGKARREGVVTKVLGKGSYQVALGTMRITLKGRELQKPRREESPSWNVSYTGETPPAVMTLDVRGLTLEEALRKLDLQIESALVHGLSRFSVIHGYGDGILSRGIGEYLKRHPRVKDYRFALSEDGGMGKTYVML